MGVGWGQPTKRVANCILILVCKDDKSKKLGTPFAILFEEDTCNITLTFCLCSCQSVLVDYESGFLYLCHMIVWILNSPPLHQYSIVQCVGSVGQMNCFAACPLAAKTSAYFSSIIRAHLTQVIFPFTVQKSLGQFKRQKAHPVQPFCFLNCPTIWFLFSHDTCWVS